MTNPRHQRIPVGRLGDMDFPPGTYAYVGSAMGGIARRVSRYLKEIRRPHWHIDALIPRFRLSSLWLFPSAKRQECHIAGLLNGLPHIIPIKGFGSTDCACPSHLFLMKDQEKAPLFDQLKGALGCQEALEIDYS